MSAALINSANVVIFSWTRCPYCVRAKALLTPMTKNLKIYELDTMGAEGDSIHNEIIKATGHDTVPAIFIDGKLIGGFSDADALNKAGKLTSLIQAE